MRTTEVILIDTGSKSNIIMMGDIGKMKHAVQLTQPYTVSNPLLHKLMKIHFSYRINCKVELPLKSIWDSANVLNQLTADNSKEYIIIVVNNAIHKFSIPFLNRLSERPNIHLVSLLLDSFARLPKAVPAMIRKTNFELIYSFQQSDCEKYGFLYTNKIYSKASLPKTETPQRDVYFIGADKGRIKLLAEIYQKLTNAGFSCDFWVIVSEGRLEAYSAKYPYLHLITKRISYDEILRKIATSRCILELCQKGQDGLTMRFYEAIFYNRLLITNNPTAQKSPYFSSGYMNFIQTAEDLNLSMLRDITSVDYGYQNEYSPVHFVEEIKQKLHL